MKLHVLNDLHIEFEDFEPPATDADVAILAGDVGVGMGGLHWAEKRFPDRPVIYVPGNHEFYHQDITLVEALKERAPGGVQPAGVCAGGTEPGFQARLDYWDLRLV